MIRKISFLFIGDGALLNSLKKSFKGHSNITFRELPRANQNNLMLVILVCNQTKYVWIRCASKSYNILSAGKPICV